MQNRLKNQPMEEEGRRSPDLNDLNDLKLRHTFSEADADPHAKNIQLTRSESNGSATKEDMEETIQRLMNIIKERENEIDRLRKTVSSMEAMNKGGQ